MVCLKFVVILSLGCWICLYIENRNSKVLLLYTFQRERVFNLYTLITGGFVVSMVQSSMNSSERVYQIRFHFVFTCCQMYAQTQHNTNHTIELVNKTQFNYYYFAIVVVVYWRVYECVPLCKTKHTFIGKIILLCMYYIQCTFNASYWIEWNFRIIANGFWTLNCFFFLCGLLMNE